MSHEILKLWTGPIPDEHLYVSPENRPEGLKPQVRLYFRKWFVHPFKRYMAHVYSSFLSGRGCEIIGITGSAGKTTAKEMIASVLSQGYKTVKSPGNIDPVYNIPQTVIHTPPDTQKLVLEMGIEYPGEMAYYLWLTQPKTGVVTTIYFAHTEFLGDLQSVIREKGKLIESLPNEGHAILNIDDPNTKALAGKTKAKLIWYGVSDGADIKGEDLHYSKDFKTVFTLAIGSDREEIELNLLGFHFVPLALAAAAIGSINGLTMEQIKKGLQQVQPIEHRMIPILKQDNTLIIDDSYNANPLAVKEAIRVLSEVGAKRRKILVLGEMRELGEFAENSHREVGRVAVELGIDFLFCLGELTKLTIDEAVKNGMPSNFAFHMVDDKGKLIELLRKTLKPRDAILIKGSRALGMEEVVEALR